MHIIADVGNTHIKAALIHEREVIQWQKFNNLDALTATFRAWQHQGAHELFYSSVRKENWKFPPMTLELFSFDDITRLPIGIDYTTPETLGKDRIADAVGAHVKFSGANALAIDCGTCITYNVVADHAFRGGAISPGVHMRLKAMHHFTGRLPLLEVTDATAIAGKSTADAMMSGAVMGAAAEIEGMIRSFCSAWGPLNVVITGGDQPLLEQHLESPIFADPLLTLTGLNEIFLFQYRT